MNPFLGGGSGREEMHVGVLEYMKVSVEERPRVRHTGLSRGRTRRMACVGVWSSDREGYGVTEIGLDGDAVVRVAKENVCTHCPP